MNTRFLCILCFSIPFVVLVESVAMAETREQRELKMAEKSVLSSIAVFGSPKGRELCAREPLACAGADKAELGLALIGARNSGPSVYVLVHLLRFRMDGSLSEDFECYVLKHAAQARPYLKQVKPGEIAKLCQSEVQQLIANDPKSFAGLDTNSVCADEQSIQKRSKELVRAIDAGSKCPQEQF